MTDGPYLETKEVLGGFWVIDAPDLDVALRLAAEGVEGVPRQGRGPPVRRHRLSGGPPGQSPSCWLSRLTIGQAPSVQLEMTV